MMTLYTGIADSAMQEMLKKKYGEIIFTPLIEIVPVKDKSQLKEVASKIYDFDYLLFTSRFAVKYFVEYLSLPFNKKLQVVSIGTTTSQTLVKYGITDFQQCENDNSYGVIDWFSSKNRGKILFPRSEIALPIIPEGLTSLGFETVTVTAYSNVMPSEVKKVDLNEISRIVFSSPSTIDNFERLYGSLPADIEYVARGPVTERNLQNILSKYQL